MKNNSEDIRKLINQAFTSLDVSKTSNQDLLHAIANNQLSNPTKSSPTKKLTFLISIIMLAIISTFLFLNVTSQITSQTIQNYLSAKSSIKHYFSFKPKEKNIANYTNSLADIKSTKEITTFTKTPSHQNIISIIDNQVINTPTNNPAFKDEPLFKLEDSVYIFPTLTEDEIKANNKQKKKMVELLAKQGKQTKLKYCYIPTGTYSKNNEQISLQSFCMQTTEVTNLEYRTFLFDLLIRNRKDEFLKAKPNQHLWIKAITKTEYRTRLAKEYFSEKEFNDFPVVNITQEGAEMYCKWLTIEANLYLSNKGKKLINDIRLPSITEWEYAAKGGLNGDYPWGYNKIQNKNNCFMANFSIEKNKTDLNFNCEAIKHKEALTTAALMLNGEQTSVYVFAYNPNDYGVYCMSGNVSEMVYLQDKNFNVLNTVVSKGGSWNSDYESCKINQQATANTKLGEPTLGFRPVFSFIKK